MEEIEDQFSRIAVLIGDKSRAIMLWNLLDGRSYTASELAVCADVSPQSASNHLTKLVASEILAVTKQGRHRYYTFQNASVAQAIESMASLIPNHEGYKRVKRPHPKGLTEARTCYDHLAGALGVKLTEALIDNGILKFLNKDYVVTSYGEKWFLSFGIDVRQLKNEKRSLAYQCLDWSERRHHIAGALGAKIFENMLQKGWVKKVKNSRQIILLPEGKKMLKELLNLDV